ncbi:MAG: threonine synthase [Myxococcota bacterium]
MTIDLCCVRCQARYPAFEPRYVCDCGGTLDVVHHERPDVDLAALDARRASRDPLDRSGVWRYREFILPVDPAHVVARHEGNTPLYEAPTLARYTGLDALWLKHEGENPTGSFKDRGMTVAVTMARVLGKTRVACASTGNTSASMASYAAIAGMQGYVFVPAGKVAFGKLSQAIAYGARTIQIEGDFDRALQLVREVCDTQDVYLVNSVNPFRIEGQKAIGFEILQDLGWQVPDWIVMPGGNLGNNSAIAKGLQELHAHGLIDRLPRIAVVQAAGASPLVTAFDEGADVVPVQAETIASAIRIGDPVSWRKSLRGLSATDGVAVRVDDQAIVDAKAQVDASGIGAEPASCATVAGLKRLVASGVVARDAQVVGILTGHLLKDPELVVNYHAGQLEGLASPYANPPVTAEATLDGVLKAMDL